MVAVDVMGGDHAPHAVLEGALAAAQKSIPIKLCGPREFICQWLDCHNEDWQNLAITVVDAQEVIAMGDEPVVAVRSKKESSLCKAVALVADGKSDVVLSAGSTGALMVASSLMIGKKEGVQRPAIAGFIASKKRSHVLILDLGANTECRPGHLLQFAHMGVTYVTTTGLHTHPTVGLLSNGTEEGKGPQVVKEAYQLLRNDATLNFMGNVEPYDVFDGKADIVVCDGFVGNILLKTMEAVSALTQSEKVMPAQSCASLQQVKTQGALLLGVKRPVLVCHGNSCASDIESAITYAWNISCRNKYNM